MATKNQILDMTPVGMQFTVLQSAADTGGKSLDLHWELLPHCNMKDPLVHVHPHAIETMTCWRVKWSFSLKTNGLLPKEVTT